MLFRSREQPLLQVKDLAAGYAFLARLAVRGQQAAEEIALPKHVDGVAKALRALEFEGKDATALGSPLQGSLALERMRESVWPAQRMVLTDKGRKPGVKTVFLVDEGRFKGYTTSELASELKDFSLLQKKCTPVEDGGPYLNSLLADAFWAGRLQTSGGL